MAGIRMPDERSLPSGPLRDLTLTIHELYRAAGRPPVREVARKIMDNSSLQGTASHESVRKVLTGKLTRWEVLEAVGRQLALMAHPPREPSAVALTLIRDWNRAREITDSDRITVVTESAKADYSTKIRTDADELAELLVEMDRVLEENASEFVNEFVQRRGGVDVESAEEILERSPQIASLLAGKREEATPDLLAELLSILPLLLNFESVDVDVYDYQYSRDMAFYAVRSSPYESFSQVQDFLRELQDAPMPGDVIHDYIRSEDDDFVQHINNRCTQLPQLVPSFQENLKSLIQLAHEQVRARSLERQRSRQAKSAERTYRQLVAAKTFLDAQVTWEVLAGQDQTCADDLRQQTGFVWLEGSDRDVMAGLWSRLAIGNPAQQAIRNESPSSGRAMEANKAQSSPNSSASAPGTDLSQRKAAVSTATGTAVFDSDLDPGKLIRNLFRISDDQVEEVTRQLSSRRSQQTRPCEFRAVPLNVKASVCYVLCYRSTRPLTVATLGPDVIRRERILSNDGVDYLVVISINSEIDPELYDLTTDWSEREVYPFAVRLFGIADLRTAVVDPEVLRASLSPRLRLSKGWLSYLRNPALLTFPGEQHRPLDQAYRTQLPTRFADENGTPLPKTAFDHVESWLLRKKPELDQNNQGLVVLGGFGDGKTFFTYNLARRLCEESLSTPDRVCVPLRLALRDLPTSGNARELLSKRLDDIGLGMADWQLLVNAVPTLIILDGFDEMSTDLSSESILRNIKLLRGCYQLFAASNILLTSRGGAFGTPADQQRLFERINKPQVVHLQLGHCGHAGAGGSFTLWLSSGRLDMVDTQRAGHERERAVGPHRGILHPGGGAARFQDRSAVR